MQVMDRGWHSVLLLLFTIVTVLYVPPCYSDCALNEFMCENHDCIMNTQKCDGIPQCADNSDEGGICDCPDTDTSLFMCNKKGVCIFKVQQCDGHPDCPDREDEMFCKGEFSLEKQCNNW